MYYMVNIKFALNSLKNDETVSFLCYFTKASVCKESEIWKVKLNIQQQGCRHKSSDELLH